MTWGQDDAERIYEQAKWDRFRASIGEPKPYSAPFKLVVEHALSPKLPDTCSSRRIAVILAEASCINATCGFRNIHGVSGTDGR